MKELKMQKSKKREKEGAEEKKRGSASTKAKWVGTIYRRQATSVPHRRDFFSDTSFPRYPITAQIQFHIR